MPGTTAGLRKAWILRRARGDHLRHALYSRMGKKSRIGAFGQDPDFASRASRERWRRERIRRNWQQRKLNRSV